MSPTTAMAGMRGPKNTLRQRLSKYTGVSTSPIAASTIVITRKPIVNCSLWVIPRKTVISLTNPLMPGRAKEARELARKKAKVIGRALARPPILGIDRVLVRS